jgi:hypothetical protein
VLGDFRRHHLRSQLAEIEAGHVDLGAVDRDLAHGDRHQHQAEENRAGEDRGPEEAALVFPEFAAQQPAQLVGRIVGGGVRHGGHA